jgi:hypothetical protein
MEINSYFQKLPVEIQNLFHTIQNENFDIYLTGGAIRDFLLFGKISKDIDLEVVPKDFKLESYHQLKKKLLNKIEGESLPFEILRLSFDQFTVEISPPRIEKYSEQESHKNFTPSFSFEATIDDRIKRRDFTANALYFKYNFENFIYKGPESFLNDLNDKKLHNISIDFSRDPVRSLRAFRFKINLNFEFSHELILELSKMNPMNASAHYRILELKKCKKPMLMLNQLSMFYQWDWDIIDQDIPYEEISDYLWIHNKLKNLEFYSQFTETKSKLKKINLDVKFDSEWKISEFQDIKSNKDFLKAYDFIDAILSSPIITDEKFQQIISSYHIKGITYMQFEKIKNFQGEVDYSQVDNKERKIYKFWNSLKS